MHILTTNNHTIAPTSIQQQSPVQQLNNNPQQHNPSINFLAGPIFRTLLGLGGGVLSLGGIALMTTGSPLIGAALLCAGIASIVFAVINPYGAKKELLKINSDCPYSIPASTMEFIKKNPHPRAKYLTQFFVDKNYMPSSNAVYDMGVEDIFGVLWIDPRKDQEFLTTFRDKFQKDLHLLNKVSVNCHFRLDDSTRLANNDIASFLNAAQTEPKLGEMFRYTLTYCLSKPSVTPQS